MVLTEAALTVTCQRMLTSPRIAAPTRALDCYKWWLSAKLSLSARERGHGMDGGRMPATWQQQASALCAVAGGSAVLIDWRPVGNARRSSPRAAHRPEKPAGQVLLWLD